MYHNYFAQAYFRFWDLGGIQGFLFGGNSLLWSQTQTSFPTLTSLFPSEGIEMMSGFTNSTSKWLPIFILKVICLTTYQINIKIMIFIFHFGGKCSPPEFSYFQIWDSWGEFPPPPHPTQNTSVCLGSGQGSQWKHSWKRYVLPINDNCNMNIRIC
jgi:hypothetical protein